MFAPNWSISSMGTELANCRETVLRSTGVDPVAATGGNADVEQLAAVADIAGVSFLGNEIARNDRPELTAARITVSGGHALGSSDKFNEVLTPLADKLGAALGASRAAVDASHAAIDWQVGQTGKIVAPSLYIACGTNGANQHLVGMKDSKIIVAIIKDTEAQSSASPTTAWKPTCSSPCLNSSYCSGSRKAP
jgi:electron transfer flavoprotein alpha subunit